MGIKVPSYGNFHQHFEQVPPVVVTYASVVHAAVVPPVSATALGVLNGVMNIGTDAYPVGIVQLRLVIQAGVALSNTYLGHNVGLQAGLF